MIFGKNKLIPYLLHRRVTKLDYLIISHFDTDHCRGTFSVMEELTVKNVIIGKQFESSENYQRFIEIVNQRNIKVLVVEGGTRMQIEKEIYLEILWPNQKNKISTNVLNNNSLVCKLVYQQFSILLTGDIEEIAEKEILHFYQNHLKNLEATVLKVAHHGSKSSSTEEFLDAVNPKIALIGVGKKNTFGHPSKMILERLAKRKIKTYRTDLSGEIMLQSDGNRFWITTYITK